MINSIGTYPIGYSNTIVFEIQKENEAEVFEIDNYQVTIGLQSWDIPIANVTTEVILGKTTYFIPWFYTENDFLERGNFKGCLKNTTKEINKYLDFNFIIGFENQC